MNACQSATLRIDPLRSIGPALIRAEVPAVVAMQLSVSVEGARAFASEFYQALAQGHPIDACVTEGRKAVMAMTGLGRPDWGIPVVYTRAHDGRLFAPAAPATPGAPGDSRSIGDGLLALRTLMETPVVYAAVSSGRDQFQNVLRQISTLGRYKGLHDLLQQLDDCAHVVDQDRRRLPQDLRAWGDLARSEPDLYTRIDAVLGLTGDASADAFWVSKLARSQQEARMGVEEGDLDRLNSAMNRIDDVLGSVPWRINTRLVEVATSLPLRALARNLSTVAAKLDTLDLDAWSARQCAVFVQGVAALERLDLRLAELVRRHNLFQELENELRRVEAGIDLEGRSLALAWPDLQPLHLQVCDDLSLTWVPKLVATATELEQSLVAWAPKLVATATELERSPADALRQRTTLIFWRYRGQVSQSFNHVDADLLKLCEELQEIGKSLDFVLRTVP